MDWKYLNTELYGVRLAMAAYFLRPCSSVVEIGPYGRHLSWYLRPGVPVIEIGPHAGYDPSHNVLAFHEHFNQHSPIDALPVGYGIAVLGMDLDGLEKPDWDALLAIMSKANRVVVEYVTDYSRAIGQASRVHEALSGVQPLVADIGVTFDGPAVNLPGWPPRPNRRLRVYGEPE